MIPLHFVHSQNDMHVTAAEAANMAELALARIEQQRRESQLEVLNTMAWYYKGDVAIYEVLFASGESVIVSGNKATQPILAIDYNSNGVSVLLNQDSLPDGYRYMLYQLYREVCLCFDSGFHEHKGWQRLVQSDEIPKQNRSIYGPYLTTKWTQSNGNKNCECSNDGYYEEVYNKYMPLSNGDCASCGTADTRYPTGCTVTALGQIMNYWKHPLLFLGEKQIDWCNMPDSVDCKITTELEKEAVAQLMGLLGRTLGTTYGTLRNLDDHCYGYLNPASTTDKLVNTFGYDESVNCIYRAWYIGSWHNTIKEEIISGRPVLYWAVEDNPSNGAHTFVCDGYDSANDLFHFNWGHGNSGSWCSIHTDSIIEGPNAHWTRYESAMIKLQPRIISDVCDARVPLEVFYHGYYSLNIIGYNENTPSVFLNPKPYGITPLTMTILESASATSRSEFRTIPNGTSAVYQAHKEIRLNNGFTAERGCDFTARIEPCEMCEGRNLTEGITETLIMDGLGRENQNNPGETEADACPQPQPTPDGLYPNPTDGKVTATTDGKADAIVIYTMDGRPIGGWNILSLDDNQVTLDVSTLPSAPYLLTIRTPNGITTKKLVVSR